MKMATGRDRSLVCASTRLLLGIIVSFSTYHYNTNKKKKWGTIKMLK